MRESGFHGSLKVARTNDLRTLFNQETLKSLRKPRHVSDLLTAANRSDYLPGRIEISKLHLPEQLWLLVYWIPKSNRIKKTTDVIDAQGNTSGGLKLIRDVPEDHHLLRFASANTFITAVTTRMYAMLNCTIATSQGYIAPQQRGDFMDYSMYLMFRAKTHELEHLAYFDSALMESREQGQWDFNIIIPPEPYRALAEHMKTMTMRICDFCGEHGHTTDKCKLRQATTDVDFSRIREGNSHKYKGPCPYYNESPSAQSTCVHGDKCFRGHYCMLCMAHDGKEKKHSLRDCHRVTFKTKP